MKFIVDRTMPDFMVSILEKYGKVYKSGILNIKDTSVSTHPDMQIHFVTENTAICYKGLFEYYRNLLPKNISLMPGICDIGYTYPLNCAYNVVRMGDYVICNEKYAEKTIIDYYKMHNKTIINVKQGYTKCNVCPISDNVFFTEDRGIYNSTKHVNSLMPILLEKGDVSLKGFDYGFIGGATGYFYDKVLFCGSLDNAINKTKIELTLLENKKEKLELSNLSLQDYGSIIIFDKD